MSVIAVVSGGMDSVTLAYDLAQHRGDDVVLVSFNYGQRHSKEIASAAKAAVALRAEHVIVPLRIGPLLSGSALTDPTVDVPHGHYEADTMKATVVPNRNAIMLSVAVGLAVARHATGVFTAVHAGDHAIYPDCRPTFIKALEVAALVGNEGFIDPAFQLGAPYVHMTKADIVRRGQTMDVSYADTWSCYEGGELHCGECGTCQERRWAFGEAGVPDPTRYTTTPALATT